MRVRATAKYAVLVLALTSATGCGGDDATQGTDAEQITALARQFAADAKDKDWTGVCDALSTKAKVELTAAGALLGGGDCAEIIAKAYALDDDSDEGIGDVDPDKVKVSAIKVTGDRATADVSPSDDDDPTTRFIREDGRWKIEGDLDEDDDDDSSSTTSGTESDDETAPEAQAPTLQVPERGFSRLDEDTVSYGIVVRNPGPQDASGVEVKVNLLGADGGVIATETDNLVGIPAANTANVGGVAEVDGRVARLEITVTADSGSTSGTVKLPKVSRVRLSHDDFGFKVRAEVSNTLAEPLSAISDVFAVLRSGAGKIVGGVSGYPESDIEPGGRAAVELVDLNDVPSAQSADLTVDAETSG